MTDGIKIVMRKLLSHIYEIPEYELSHESTTVFSYECSSSIQVMEEQLHCRKLVNLSEKFTLISFSRQLVPC